MLDETMRHISSVLAAVDEEIQLVRDFRNRVFADVVTGKLDVRQVEVLSLDEWNEVDELEDEELNGAEDIDEVNPDLDAEDVEA
jgi:type I restriction enzyme S subunit